MIKTTAWGTLDLTSNLFRARLKPAFRNSIRFSRIVLIGMKTRTMATTVINTPRDPNTLSNYNNWRTTHTSTNFDILFDEQKLKGSVTHSLEAITDGESDEILLDSSHVQINSIKADGKSVEWELLKRLEPYGSPLEIKLGRKLKLKEKIDVSIDVETTTSCTALVSFSGT